MRFQQIISVLWHDGILDAHFVTACLWKMRSSSVHSENERFCHVVVMLWHGTVVRMELWLEDCNQSHGDPIATTMNNNQSNVFWAREKLSWPWKPDKWCAASRFPPWVSLWKANVRRISDPPVDHWQWLRIPHLNKISRQKRQWPCPMLLSLLGWMPLSLSLLWLEREDRPKNGGKQENRLAFFIPILRATFILRIASPQCDVTVNPKCTQLPLGSGLGTIVSRLWLFVRLFFFFWQKEEKCRTARTVANAFCSRTVTERFLE